MATERGNGAIMNLTPRALVTAHARVSFQHGLYDGVWDALTRQPVEAEPSQSDLDAMHFGGDPGERSGYRECA